MIEIEKSKLKEIELPTGVTGIKQFVDVERGEIITAVAQNNAGGKFYKEEETK